MKSIITILTLLTLTTTAYSREYTNQAEYTPEIALGVGLQTGPLSDENNLGYVSLKAYLINFHGDEISSAHLLGLGIQYNARNQTFINITPMSFTVKKINFGGEFGISTQGLDPKLGFSIGYLF